MDIFILKCENAHENYFKFKSFINIFGSKIKPPCIFHSWVQSSLVQATYWHDPLDEKTYKQKSEFLADINNEREINQTYIDNLNRLENLVLVKFDKDTIVQPRETEWFGFYAPGQAKKLLRLQETELYLQVCFEIKLCPIVRGHLVVKL